MKRSIKMAVSEKVLMAVIYLVMILFCLCVIGPFMNIIAVSFSGRNAVTSGRVSLWLVDFNVEAYKKVLTTQYFGRAYLNTVLIVLAGTPLSLAVTVLMAYPLSRSDLPGKRALTFILTLTMWFSGGMIPSFILVNKLGLYDSYWALILPGLVSAYNIIIVRNFFAQTPVSLEESAKLDGAGEMTVLVRIFLPLSLPVLATITLWLVVGYWNTYLSALLYLSTRAKYTLQLVLREIVIADSLDQYLGIDPVDNATRTVTESIKYANILLTILPIMCVYPFLQRFFMKGVLLGAVKG